MYVIEGGAELNIDREEIRSVIRHEDSVRGLIETMLALPTPDDDEPLVSFTVRVPVTEVAVLDTVARYLGERRGPFAAQLLGRAAMEAAWDLLEIEQGSGRGDKVREALSGKMVLQDGEGHVEMSKFRAFGEGEVR